MKEYRLKQSISSGYYKIGIRTLNSSDTLIKVKVNTPIDTEIGLKIAMFYGSRAEARELLRNTDSIDILILGDCPLGLPPEKIEGRLLVYAGQRGLYLSRTRVEL